MNIATVKIYTMYLSEQGRILAELQGKSEQDLFSEARDIRDARIHEKCA